MRLSLRQLPMQLIQFLKIKDLFMRILLFYLSFTFYFCVGALSAENIVLMDLKSGQVRMELYPDVAPQHVVRIKELADSGFYDGIVFHRVIAGFMAQTGDPTGTGRGGSDKPNLPAEFNKVPFDAKGILGMARSASPNSANSQFFITLAPAEHLNGQYTVFGRVLSGMEHVESIKQGDAATNGIVSNPDKIIKFRTEDNY